MRFAGVVQDHTSQLHPGVGLKTPRLFSSTDAQVGWDTAPGKEPPEHQRLLETTGVENEMPGGRLQDACDFACSCDPGLVLRDVRQAPVAEPAE